GIFKFSLSPVQYSTLNVGLSSGRLCRRSYSRVVAMFACPSHSCTLAISALCASALVAAVARKACTQKPCTSAFCLAKPGVSLRVGQQTVNGHLKGACDPRKFFMSYLFLR